MRPYLADLIARRISHTLINLLNKLDAYFPPIKRTFTLKHIISNSPLILKEHDDHKRLMEALNKSIFIYNFLKSKKTSPLSLSQILDQQSIIFEIQRLIKVVDVMMESGGCDVEDIRIAFTQFSIQTTIPNVSELSHRLAEFVVRIKNTMIDKRGNILPSYNETILQMGRMGMALVNANKSTPWDETPITEEEFQHIQNILLPKLMKKQLSIDSLPLSRAEIERAIIGFENFFRCLDNLTSEVMNACAFLFPFTQKKEKGAKKNSGKIAENVLIMLLGIIYEHFFSRKPTISRNEYEGFYYGPFYDFLNSCLKTAKIDIPQAALVTRWYRIQDTDRNFLKRNPSLGNKEDITLKLFAPMICHS